MSTNSMTYGAATRTTDRAMRANTLYSNLIRRATRHALNGDDRAADNAAERARRHAHAESYKGNTDPLLDQLARHYGIDAPTL